MKRKPGSVKKNSTAKSTRPRAAKTNLAKELTPFEAYFAGLSAASRDCLQHLREVVHATAPGAEECISYAMPAFRYRGKILVYLGASARHCTFYPGSGTAVAANAAALADFDCSKGSIRFQPDDPPSDALIRKIVRYRMAENAASGKSPPRRGPAHSYPAARPAVGRKRTKDL